MKFGKDIHVPLGVHCKNFHFPTSIIIRSNFYFVQYFGLIAKYLQCLVLLVFV